MRGTSELCGCGSRTFYVLDGTEPPSGQTVLSRKHTCRPDCTPGSQGGRLWLGEP